MGPAMGGTALRRIERSLRASDPGLLRSAQAFKTLLAVLLAWGAVRGLGWQTSSSRPWLPASSCSARWAGRGAPGSPPWRAWA